MQGAYISHTPDRQAVASAGLCRQHVQQCLQRRTLQAPRSRHRHVVEVNASPLRTSESTASTSGRSLEAPAPLITIDEVRSIAAQRGLRLSLQSVGPVYKIQLSRAPLPGQREEILGVTTGFYVPLLGILHCDTLQVYTQGFKGEAGQRIRGGPFGLGLLLGGATFAYGHSQGAKKAEILAIDDDAYTHKRLVTYYKFFGFEPVKEVRSKLRDLPDLLIWGGEGMRMDADVQVMLKRWTRMLRKQAAQQETDVNSASDS